MKKLLFSVCAFIMISVAASAQYVASSSNAATGGSSQSSAAKFGTFGITYSPTTLNSIEGNSSSSEEMQSVSLTWTKADALHPVQPVYLEYGLGAQWTFQNDDDDDVNVSTNFIGLKIPVNILYKYDVPQTNFSIMPYAGLNLTGYVLGSTSAKSGDDKFSLSYFSKDDMGEDKFNRITVGWQVGARVRINNSLFVGIAYEGPITHLYKEGDYKINFNHINISLGLEF